MSDHKKKPAAVLGLGLIGTGFMGKAHALAYRNARAVLGTQLPKVELVGLCDLPLEHAQTMAEQFGFARACDYWQELIALPEVDIIAIAAPNKLHCEIALAALAAGKHVHCEKPLALTFEQATEMAAAAEQAAGRTQVGYSYVHNPAITHAVKLLQDNAIGKVVHFRGWIDEDYLANPELPWTWRSTLAEAGLGVLGDLACHLISLVHLLVGPIDSLVADMQTVHKTRKQPDGSMGAVENEDTATALLHFPDGVHGSISASRSAWGRKSRLSIEIHGTEGMLVFDQERMNELQLYQNRGEVGEQGFKTILTSAEHPPYGDFCPAPGHQIGFNDLKLLEVGGFLQAIAEEREASPNFSEAYAIEKVVYALVRSATEQRRVALAEM